MKKIILWTLLVIIIGGGGFLTWHFLSPYKKTDIYNVIPPKPVFIIETDDSYQMWESLTESRIWSVLSKHSLFAKFGEGFGMIDSIIQQNPKIVRYLGKRNMVVSMHILKKGQYEFVYAVDLRRISKILPVKDFLAGFLSGFEVKTSVFEGQEIYRLQNKENSSIIYLSFLDNILVASLTKKFVELSISQRQNPVLTKNINFIGIRERVKGKGLLRLFINYSQIDDYLNAMLVTPDPNLRQISKSLFYSGLAFDINNDNLISCEGFTNYNDTIASSFRAMTRSGKGKTGLLDVLPQQTASTVSLGFEKFTLYYDNIFANLNEVPKNYAESEATLKQVEKYLKIDVRKNIMDWISDEAAMVHLAPMGLGRGNEFAVFLKTNDMGKARENLEYIMKQIKKKTPVKFQQVEYNGYMINYLSMKGFFKLLLGKYFQKLDKPYFSYIGDYVVFSNHPQTLKIIIDGVEKERLLADLADYKPFSGNFSRKSNILAVLHTEQFLKSLQGQVTPAVWDNFQKNKEYIVCFPYFGFQLEAEGTVFNTKLMVKFTEQTNSIEAKDNVLPDDTILYSDSTGIQTSEEMEVLVKKLISSVDDYFPDDPNSKVYRESYPNGQTKVEFQLRDGFRHGDYTEYYENGNLKISGQFNKDHKEGVWKIYNEKEKLLKKLRFKEDKLE